jgi:hypothetical protein
MKVAGFTFIRNAILYDYPVKEAILSVLPLCDQFVVAVGKSDDDTLQYIRAIQSPKIKIIETVWDDTMRKGGRVLALETDKAYRAIDEDVDWCFYIQGDEILHEKYLDTVRNAMLSWKDDPKVDGLLFRYRHFYGSYDYVATSSSWYKNEVRVIRKNTSFYSYRDAQGFRKGDDEKLRVKSMDAEIYHYGWVKHPAHQQAKQKSFQKLWHDDTEVQSRIVPGDHFDYSGIDKLAKFTGTHPAVMHDRIQAANWTFDHDISKNRTGIKERFKSFLLKYLGWDVSYRNYREV